MYSTGIDATGDTVILKAPNDLVFDNSGGFWFTDLGKGRQRNEDITGIFYAKIDGSSCKEKILRRSSMHPPNGPNGIALSPDGRTLYVAETPTGKLWSWNIIAPGELEMEPMPASISNRARKVVGRPKFKLVYASSEDYHFDSMCVDGDGNICVATLGKGAWGIGGISVIQPNGKLLKFINTGDDFTTNMCFGGENDQEAFITLSRSGKLVKMKWHCKGWRCHYENLLNPKEIIGTGSDTNRNSNL